MLLQAIAVLGAGWNLPFSGNKPQADRDGKVTQPKSAGDHWDGIPGMLSDQFDRVDLTQLRSRTL